MSFQSRLAALIAAVGTDVKSLTAQMATATNFPSYAPSGLTNTYDPTDNLYNLKGSNTKRARAALARAMNGGRMDILAIGDSILVGVDGTDTKESVCVPKMMAKNLSRSLGTVMAGTGLVCATAYGGARATDRWATTGTVTWTVGVATMYSAATVTFTSEQGGDIVDVFYDDRSTPFTVQIDGGSSPTVTPGGTTAIKRYRVTGLADTVHTVKVTAGSNWTFLVGVQVGRASGIAVHNIAHGGSRAGTGGAGVGWTDTATTGNNINFFRKGAFTESGYTPDLVLISLGANDVVAGDTPATIRTHLTTIKGWYPNSDYIFILWPGLTTMAGGTWDTFCGEMYKFADASDVPLLDFRDRYGNATEAAAMGLIGADSAHPIKGMQREMGRLLAAAYSGVGPSPVITTPTGSIAASDVPEGTVLLEWTP